MKYLNRINFKYRNPYEDFGYGLAFEEYTKPIEGDRIINNVRLKFCDDRVILSCEAYEIVTFVDLAYYIISNLGFKNHLLCEGMDRDTIYDITSKLGEPRLEFLPLDE